MTNVALFELQSVVLNSIIQDILRGWRHGV